MPPPDDPRVANALSSNLKSFFVPRAGGRIPPGSMGNVEIVEVISVDLAKAFDATLSAQNAADRSPTHPLTVHMRPVGKRAGLSINGGYVDYPVQLCRFCLSQPINPCPPKGFPSGTGINDACLPAQDGSSTCCVDPTGLLLCGPAVPITTGM